MKCDVRIEKSILMKYSAINYKYAILRQKSKDGKVEYEFVPKKAYGNEIVNRTLRIEHDRIRANSGKTFFVSFCILLFYVKLSQFLFFKPSIFSVADLFLASNFLLV